MGHGGVHQREPHPLGAGSERSCSSCSIPFPHFWMTEKWPSHPLRCVMYSIRATSRSLNSRLASWVGNCPMSHNCNSRSASSQVDASARSEEHTSELQSLMRISYAVFCLNKKKPTQKQ